MATEACLKGAWLCVPSDDWNVYVQYAYVILWNVCTYDMHMLCYHSLINRAVV